MVEKILMPPTLDKVIVALCADYSRRAEAIEKREIPFNVLMEYRFLNYRMLDAAMEIAGGRDALAFITEIAERRGNVQSSLYLSETLYKTRKKEIKVNIAKRLSMF